MYKNQIVGIYCIVNNENGKVYVGASSHIHNRWGQHRYDLTHNRHDNLYFQQEFNESSLERFTFEILEEVPDKVQLNEREDWWIENLKSLDPDLGYNIAKTVGGRRVLSDEHKARLLAANKGVPRSEGTRAKISASLTGRKRGW